jgi:hypothetical protein
MHDQVPNSFSPLQLITPDDIRADHLANLEEMARDVAEAAHARSAEGFAARLLEQIRLFEGRLDQQHEVGLRVVTFGQALTVHVEALGYIEPSLITFEGRTDSGDPVRLVQHVSQVSFLLVTLARLEPSEPRRPIGFNRT